MHHTVQTLRATAGMQGACTSSSVRPLSMTHRRDLADLQRSTAGDGLAAARVAARFGDLIGAEEAGPGDSGILALALQGDPTLEVRWIFPGTMSPSLMSSFLRFPSRSESRDDLYLRHLPASELSAKIRGDELFEVKVRKAVGRSLWAGEARGRLELWQKWSWPLAAARLHEIDPVEWRLVGKTRQIADFPSAI